MLLIRRLTFLILIILTLFSFVKKRELPTVTVFPESTRHSPIQTRTARGSFTAITPEDGRTHEVTPLYDYKIAGMVVSTRHSKTLSDYYQDKLNVLDVGIIWGENLNPEIYQKIQFHSNGVRLFWETKDDQAFSQFNKNKVSNSHLLCIDSAMIKQVKKIKRGDVVQIRGFLADYSGRSSSTVRTDTGDGACEVLWVEELSLLQNYTTPWDTVFKASLGSISIWVILTFALFFRGPINRKPVKKAALP